MGCGLILGGSLAGNTTTSTGQCCTSTGIANVVSFSAVYSIITSHSATDSNSITLILLKLVHYVRRTLLHNRIIRLNTLNGFQLSLKDSKIMGTSSFRTSLVEGPQVVCSPKIGLHRVVTGIDVRHVKRRASGSGTNNRSSEPKRL